MYTYLYDTKIGKISITEDMDELTGLSFFADIPEGSKIKETSLLAEAIRQLTEYLNGKRTVFDLPLNPKGTPFQRKVWQVLTTTPYGETFTYSEGAEAIGNAKACRARGMAKK